ncbi:MAG TPA: MFS transporter [Steroidobacteraceae bacterium]|nr:MFS transporter [Steroidobacteraceae bacterium]
MRASLTRGRVFTYENGLLLILGLAFGIAFFDRNAGSILVPFIEHDIPLNNTQTGLIGSALSITWALGAYLIARWSDASGVRKPFLLAFLLIFSVCSFLSGLSRSFPMLLLSRMVMGAVEGPFLPVCLALMAVESSEHRRGINAGVMQNFFASVLGQSLAPLLLVALAQTFSWRAAFYIAGVPGVLCALAVLLWVREPNKAAQASLDAPGVGGSGSQMGLGAMLRQRNILLCCLISIFMVTWLIMGWTFLPKFFTDDRHLSPAVMSYLMTSLGVASALSSFTVPALSDRLGRKPVIIAFCFLGVLSPLAALYIQGPPVLIGALMFAGWFGSGTFPLFMGVIPGETISRRYAATAMGLVVCVGEVVGGFGITSVSGALADAWSVSAPVLIEAGCAVAGGLLCLLLVETAPARVSAAAAHRVAADALRREAS